MEKKTVSIIMVISLIALVGSGGTALAYRGWGGGDCPGGGPGWQKGGDGWHHHQNLSEADIEKLNEQRKAFFKNTQDLRNDIIAKELELRAELAKKNPDANVAASLQKELSELEAQFDQKRIEHRIKMREINPNAGQGFAYGPGARRGWGGGGPGYCRR